MLMTCGPWTRGWLQFRHWSRNGTWAQALVVLHAAARESDGRAERTSSMVVIDAHRHSPPDRLPTGTAECGMSGLSVLPSGGGLRAVRGREQLCQDVVTAD